MPIASKLSQFLDSKGIMSQSLHHPRSEDFGHAIELTNAIPELCVKSVALIDDDGPVVAAISYLAELDLELINKTFNRKLQYLNDQTADRLFKDCESGALPALAMAYGLPVMVDSALLENEYVFCASGCASTLLKIPGLSFRLAMIGAIKGRISKWPENKSETCERWDSSTDDMSLTSVAKKLQRLYQLPPMPETAIRIMHLTSNPDSDVAELATLIEQDPSLTAQVMRYARSALFSYRGELSSIKEAVNIVLGFDRVSQLAMGISASKAFTIPDDGPLGLSNFWTHALYVGVFSQGLAMLANPDLELDDKNAYLAGLLHNFGLLLIGHLFPPEFKMLNKIRDASPELSMSEIEQQVFGMGGAQEFISIGHGSIGAILLKMWGLPDFTVKVAAMHQNLDYQGDDQHYVWLVQLANYYLSQYGIGDETVELDSAYLLSELGIDPKLAQSLIDDSIEQCRSLDGMINQMSA